MSIFFTEIMGYRDNFASFLGQIVVAQDILQKDYTKDKVYTFRRRNQAGASCRWDRMLNRLLPFVLAPLILDIGLPFGCSPSIPDLILSRVP